jgi:hypothetical protein
VKKKKRCKYKPDRGPEKRTLLLGQPIQQLENWIYRRRRKFIMEVVIQFM